MLANQTTLGAMTDDEGAPTVLAVDWSEAVCVCRYSLARSILRVEIVCGKHEFVPRDDAQPCV
jgi:hypothetical protein